MKWSEGEPYLFVIFAIRVASSLRCALFKLRISLSLSFCPLLKWTLSSGGGFCLRLQRTPLRHIHAARSSCPTIFLFSLCLCLAILKHCIYPRISAHCMFTRTSGEASRVSPSTHANSCRRQANLSLALPSSLLHSFIHFPEKQLPVEGSIIHSFTNRNIYLFNLNKFANQIK